MLTIIFAGLILATTLNVIVTQPEISVRAEKKNEFQTFFFHNQCRGGMKFG